YLVSSGWRSFRRWRAGGPSNDGRLRLFLWLWVLIPITFFSFSGSKLPGYILPIFPAIALLVGLELKEWWEKEEPVGMRLLVIGTASLIVVAALIFRFWGGRELGLNSFNGFKLTSLAIVV